MTQDTESGEVRPEPPPLKVAEEPVNPQEPWGDDRLQRRRVADRLTSIVRDQEQPFVITVDGGWGTGKTFLLKRWQQDLENHDWQAIYFNAWEDDFSDDPLLSVTAQLSEHFDKSSFSGTVRGLVRLVPPLLDVVAPLTPFGHIWLWLRAAAAKLRVTPPQDLRRYGERTATAERFKRRLRELGADVYEETGKPLVFIIDELDRCRPTFAIELLERVKHIFDVPNIVFVFGINRVELTKSLQSVYGEIDAAVYLRRFFDMEFTLPEPDPVEFCKSLVERYELNRILYRSAAFEDSGVRVEVDLLVGALPLLVGHMGLSLRDMDYCVRVVSLAVASDRRRAEVDQDLFAGLVALKVGNLGLYHRYMEGSARGAEVIDYFNDLTRANRRRFGNDLMYNDEGLERIAAAIYCADDAWQVRSQFLHLADDSALDHPEYLSREHQRLNSEDSERLERITKMVDEYTRGRARFGINRDSLAGLIDLVG